jgi:hypothetical protein
MDVLLSVEDLTYRLLSDASIVDAKHGTPAQITAEVRHDIQWGCCGMALYFIPNVSESILQRLMQISGQEFYRGEDVWGITWVLEDGIPVLPHVEAILNLSVFPRKTLIETSFPISKPVVAIRILRRFIIREE